MMLTLTKNDILKKADIKTERVEVPEWGGSVKVKTMSARERDSFEAGVLKEGKVNPDNFRAKLVAKTLVDDDGNRLFSDSDVEALGEKSAAAVDRVFGVAQRLNGLSAADVEDMTKK